LTRDLAEQAVLMKQRRTPPASAGHPTGGPDAVASAETRGFPAPRGAWGLVIALGIGVFVGGFDQTFVVPVLATMLSDLRIPINEFGKASWIINGYLLGYTVAMPLMGRIADVYGHLRIFVLGILIFMVGSIFVAISPNLTTLTIARAITALGGGALVPVALAIAAEHLPKRQRPLGLSTISVLDDASSLAGPLWGTLIGVWIGWRGLFWMNLALGVPVLIGVLLMARGTRTRTGGRVDWIGGALLAAALGTLTFALADASAEPRTVREALALYGLALTLAGAFVGWELRTPSPLIDLRMFRSLRLSAANIVFFLEGGALITALVNIPLMTEVLWGKSGVQPGLMLMRMVLFMLVGGLLGGLLAPRIGYRTTAFLGFSLTAAGLFGMWAWPLEPSEGARWTALAIAGLGFTLADAPIYATVMDAVDQGRRASAAALLQVLQSMGMVVGMALLASQGLGRFDERAAELFQATALEADVEQYRTIIHQTFDETFFVAGVVMVVAALISLLLGPIRDRTIGRFDAM
jgi:MFS family permease